MEIGPTLARAWAALLALLLAGARSAAGGDCLEAGSAAARTSRCLKPYTDHAALLRSTAANFYTGVDVEELRHLCHELMTSLRCTRTVKENCPDTEHTEIEVLLGDLVPTYEMCAFQDFFEVYARNQFCFERTRAEAEKCHTKFLASSAGLDRDIHVGSPAAVTQLCGHLSEFVGCLQRAVSVQCQAEAAGMVPLLVRPSVPYSEHCRNDSAPSTASPAPTVRASTEPLVEDGQAREAVLRSAAPYCLAPSSALLTALLLSLLS